MDPLRFSVLHEMAKSPAHARWRLDHLMADTAAMRFGRLVHSCFLGNNAPIVYPGARRGKDWLAFKAEHDDQDIVTSAEFERASAMAAALHCNKEARQLLMGKREQTVLFEYAGRRCRATPDVFSSKHLTDLKTTTDASPHRFPWTAMRLAYHAQLAWYKDGLQAAGVAHPQQLSIVAIESRPPYAVCVFVLTQQAEEFGRRLYRGWIEEFLVCEQNNSWPGYASGVLDAPEEGVGLIGLDGDDEPVLAGPAGEDFPF